MRATFLVAVILLAVAPLSARAAVISGPTDLLSQAYADQLETWLGEGPIEVTRIYAKQTGDDSSDFHAAVNAQGRTFALIEVLAGTSFGYSLNQADIDNVDGSGTNTYYDEQGQSHSATYYRGTINVASQIIGGYNPQSWSSSNTYNITPNDVDRTAFLFNLTSTEIQEQNLNGQGTFGSGQYQTFNRNDYGPTFGGGHDIWVHSNLASGYTFNWSYGGTSYFDNIITGGEYYDQNLQYGKIEVFTIAEGNAVPEPSSCVAFAGLFTIGLIGRWRRRRQAV